ncbi:MATE family efflux transporter, partial [Jutongia sp.]|uniref:MATE family efflux transporter n=1 Tax=Jutongia sp. TaxID=2944204 RepID=UPI003079FA39
MKQIDFENGTITGNIINAAVPMLTAQVLSLLYNIVDRIYIARIPGIGSTALGAVGLCFPVIIIITAFSNLFGGGGAPLFAIQRGMGHDRKAGRIMNTSYTMLCGCAVLLMILGLVFAGPLLKLFGASEAALAYACPYMMIYLLGTFPSMATTGLNPFINAQGYATTGMLSITIGAVANLILDPIFILVLGMGIPGAAIATLIGTASSSVFYILFIIKKCQHTTIHLRDFTFASGIAASVLAIGLPSGISTLLN